MSRVLDWLDDFGVWVLATGVCALVGIEQDTIGGVVLVAVGLLLSIGAAVVRGLRRPRTQRKFVGPVTITIKGDTAPLERALRRIDGFDDQDGAAA